jgi:hypothetical protein
MKRARDGRSSAPPAPPATGGSAAAAPAAASAHDDAAGRHAPFVLRIASAPASLPQVIRLRVDYTSGVTRDRVRRIADALFATDAGRPLAAAPVRLLLEAQLADWLTRNADRLFTGHGLEAAPFEFVAPPASGAGTPARTLRAPPPGDAPAPTELQPATPAAPARTATAPAAGQSAVNPLSRRK